MMEASSADPNHLSGLIPPSIFPKPLCSSALYSLAVVDRAGLPCCLDEKRVMMLLQLVPVLTLNRIMLGVSPILDAYRLPATESGH